MTFECSAERPWGIHPPVYNDQECTRCGWTAPGPVGDARDDALAAEAAMAAAEGLGWVLLEGGQPLGDGRSLAA